MTDLTPNLHPVAIRVSASLSRISSSSPRVRATRGYEGFVFAGGVGLFAHPGDQLQHPPGPFGAADEQVGQVGFGPVVAQRSAVDPGRMQPMRARDDASGAASDRCAGASAD